VDKEPQARETFSGHFLTSTQISFFPLFSVGGQSTYTFPFPYRNMGSISEQLGISKERASEMIDGLSKIDTLFYMSAIDPIQAATLSREIAQTEEELIWIISMGKIAIQEVGIKRRDNRQS
jgi:hypothetical protein